MTPRAGATGRELALAAVAAILLSIAMTWPIAARFDRAGRVDSGDGRFSIWNVSWVAHALTSSPGDLYDANIFYPNDNTLAYSEANLFAGLIAAPIWALTENPYAATNWAILCAFALSFFTTFALARYVSGSAAAAAAAAVWFAFCAFVFSHIPHIQLLMTFGIPLVLLRLHRFVDDVSIRNALFLGGAMALQALACGYYGIAAGLLAGFGTVWFSASGGRFRQWRYWTYAALAAIVAGLLVLPFFLPYQTMQEEGFTRTLDDARMYSVRWRAYLASPRIFDRWLLEFIGTWREVLFPGMLPVLFTGLVAFRVAGRRTWPMQARRDVLGFYVGVGILAFWISLGPDAGLYTLLYHTLPVFELLRAPARFGVVVTLALAVIGAVGFAMAARLIPERFRTVAVIVALGAVVLRSSVGGLVLTEGPPVPLAHQRLAMMPRAPVIALPYWIGPDRHRHTEYMLLSTSHWQPMVNGYSDHVPRDLVDDKPHFARFPNLSAWRAMRERAVRYVVVHWYLYGPEGGELRTALRQEMNYLRPVIEAGDVSLYEVIAWPPGTE